MEAKKDSSYNPSPFEMLLDDIIQHKGTGFLKISTFCS